MTYTKYDAMAEEAEEKYERLVSDAMDDLLAPIFAEVYSLDPEEDNDPHPWTWTRHLFEVWTEDGDDGLREYLEEDFREEAEEIVRETYEDGPCCSAFSCPCGNTNSFRGF